MKKIAVLFILILLYSCGSGKQNTAQSATYFKQAEHLLREKDFFKANTFIQANKDRFSHFHKLVLSAYVDNAFNRTEASNAHITTIFKEHEALMQDSLKLDLLRIKQLNHVRLFEYAQATEAINLLLENYSSLLNKIDLEDYKNTGKLWKMLSGQPKQRVTIADSTYIKMFRDEAGLANLKVKADQKEINFIFDTGANISTVTESTAKAFNMVILGDGIDVGTITGKTVISKIAVCPELNIGNINVKDAAFLVLPDDALTFPEMGYQINGIIGFPVIEAMKELQLTVNDEFIVPKVKTKYKENNMALDFLNPIININGEYFTFDTGATNTSLYKRYFEKYAVEVEEKYDITELQFGGAGGTLTKAGYKIVFKPVIQGRELTITDVDLFTEDLGPEASPFYGNIGQDVIKKFEKMTLNFESMFIKFD